MRGLIGTGLLAVIGLLMWAWWLPTLLTLLVVVALAVCFDWPHVRAFICEEMFISPGFQNTVEEWRDDSRRWHSYTELLVDYHQTQLRKERELRQIRGW